MASATIVRFPCVAALMLLTGSALAAPKAELWPRWQAQQAASSARVDHADWDQFLQEQVQSSSDGINRIAYARVSKPEQQKLASYLARLQAVSVSKLRREEQRAYWINLYNASTVKVILDHHPVESILKINISPGLFVRGPWGKKLLKVEDEGLSLDDIEHRILRPLWKDPRTHYALNCASVGCPNLATTAYTAANMEELLDAGARAYVNHPRGARVEKGRLRVSSIYEWFKDDFDGTAAGVIAHLKKYAAPPLATQLAGIGEISGDDYDWALNDAH